MRQLGLGISNDDLEKIAIGVMAYDDNDDDNDGLYNRLEIALGTNADQADTDGDGYSDLLEISTGYDPSGSGVLPIDKNLAQAQSGRILLQVEKNGEAWYVYPPEKRRYYLGRPADAFQIMRELGLGISDRDLDQIAVGIIGNNDGPEIPNASPQDALECGAKAIRENDLELGQICFDEPLHSALEYNLEFLDGEGRLLWSGMLLNTALSESESTGSRAIFRGEVYFSLGGFKVPIHYEAEKQSSGAWLLTNL
jgi:hypothetical protein